MTDKQIIGGRGSAKSYRTLNTIEVMLENEKLKETLKAKEQECEELKDLNTRLDNQREAYWKEYQKLKATLTEIKEVLQFYNNSKIGTDKGNGIFEFEVSNDNVLGGKLIYCYDTNPAKKALQKISEVENE